MMTSNRPIEEWGKLLSDVPTASATRNGQVLPVHLVTAPLDSVLIPSQATGKDED